MMSDNSVDETRAHTALSVGVRRSIFDILLGEGPLDIRELSRRTGLKDTTIRHHLMILQNARLVEPEKVKKVRPGRPELGYKVVREFRELGVPRRQYLLLARELLESIIAGQGLESATSTMRQIGKKLGEEILDSVSFRKGLQKTTSLGDLSATLVRTLEEMGSYPTMVKKSDDELILKFSNCIFFELAKDYSPLMCEGHFSLFQTLARGLGGYAVSQEKCAAQGGESCITVIKRSPKARVKHYVGMAAK